MKLTIERKTLLEALGRVARISPAKSTIPILSNVLLSAGTGLSLKASDLDIEIGETVAADVERGGSTTVPAKMLHDIVRKFPDGCQVGIEYTDKDVLVVKAGRSRFTLQTLSASDFPDMAASGMEHHFEIGSAELDRLITKTQFAISTEETRYYLNGIYFHLDDNGKVLVAAATDGHRLARCEVGTPEGAEAIPGIIIPRKTVTEVLRLVAATDEMVGIDLSSSKIRFSIGETVLTSKLIDGTFPDYKRVIPQGQNMTATINVGIISDAAGRVASVSTDRGRAIKLSFSPGSLELHQRSDIGESEEAIEVEYDADPFVIGFNAKYLLDVLATVDSESVKIAMSDPGAPAVVSPIGQDDALFVLMPLRIQ